MKFLSQERNYIHFLLEIKQRIREAQYSALKAVNKGLISLYWDIGKKIVEQQEKYGWGRAIVETLAIDLQKEYPGIKGFSTANLWRMRIFYLSYKESEKLAPLVREISWAKNIIIMEKCKEELERRFYIQMTKKFGWTKDVLIHQIENKAYEKYLLNQTNFDKTLPIRYRSQAKLAVKDEYTFDFLELGEEHSEKELELALLEKVRRFLIEMVRTMETLYKKVRDFESALEPAHPTPYRYALTTKGGFKHANHQPGYTLSGNNFKTI